MASFPTYFGKTCTVVLFSTLFCGGGYESEVLPGYSRRMCQVKEKYFYVTVVSYVSLKIDGGQQSHFVLSVSTTIKITGSVWWHPPRHVSFAPILVNRTVTNVARCGRGSMARPRWMPVDTCCWITGKTTTRILSTIVCSYETTECGRIEAVIIINHTYASVPCMVSRMSDIKTWW